LSSFFHDQKFIINNNMGVQLKKELIFALDKSFDVLIFV